MPPFLKICRYALVMTLKESVLLLRSETMVTLAYIKLQTGCCWQATSFTTTVTLTKPLKEVEKA